jgi:hypothetical protein
MTSKYFRSFDMMSNMSNYSQAELDEYCRLKAEAARRYADNLMAAGEPDFIAWNRAIRSEILESESN